jgi:hypothetical protein
MLASVPTEIAESPVGEISWAVTDWRRDALVYWPSTVAPTRSRSLCW